MANQRGGRAVQHHQNLMRQEMHAMQNDPEVIEAAEEAAIAALPVRVANIDIARDTARGRGEFNVGISHLENCAMIFPNGRFAWDRPNAGFHAGATARCVAEVEMRKIHGNSDIILARALVAAGDSIDCNIGAFPESGYTADAGNVIFPADNEPTMDDVRRRMNEEQRRGIGMRTATSAVIGGVGGYLLNVGGNRLASTIGGAVIAGGVGYASGAAGHVGGNVIMGAAVNAAAGGIIGNMSGIGSSSLLVDSCPGHPDIKCLFGYIDVGRDLDANTRVFFNVRDGAQRTCSATNDREECRPRDLLNVRIPPSITGTNQSMTLDEYVRTVDRTNPPSGSFCIGRDGQMVTSDCAPGESVVWNEIQNWSGIKVSGSRVQAVCFNWTHGARISRSPRTNEATRTACDLRQMNSRGTLGDPVNNRTDGAARTEDDTNDNNNNDMNLREHFYPFELDASDGKIIDINHPGRWRATAMGAGIGAALGGWTAWQGASEEVVDRWLASVREYRNSLEVIYCGTGTRLLSPYNSPATIPNIRQ